MIFCLGSFQWDFCLPYPRSRLLTKVRAIVASARKLSTKEFGDKGQSDEKSGNKFGEKY